MAKAYRAAYGTDGNYFSNFNAGDVFETTYDMIINIIRKKFQIFFKK